MQTSVLLCLGACFPTTYLLFNTLVSWQWAIALLWENALQFSLVQQKQSINQLSLLDTERSEQSVDLCSSDPGPGALEVVVEVGRPSRVHSLFPGLLY